MSRSTTKTIARVALGGALLFAGVGHLTFARESLRALVPGWVPLDQDLTVIASGIVEVLLGSALIFVGPPRRRAVGIVVALFFVAVFPGNLHQWQHHTDALGLDTDTKRLARLFFQPALIAWALLSTRRATAKP